MTSLLLPLLLAFASTPQSTAVEFEITAETLEACGSRAREAVEAALGLDLAEFARFELATPEDVKATLDIELTAQFRMQFEDSIEADKNRELFSRAISDSLLAKYSVGERKVLVVPSAFEKIAEQLKTPELLSEEAFYSVLVHEAVHAAQDRMYGWGECLRRLSSASELKTFNAVAEGHAQHVSRAICSESPWKEGFEAFTSCIGAIPESLGEAERLLARVAAATMVTAYIDGERFIAELERMGGQEAIDRAFREPPQDLDVIYHADWFLDPSKRPEKRFELERGFASLRERYSEEEWTHQEVVVERPQLEASMSILPAEEVRTGVTKVRSALLHIVANKKSPNQLLMPALIELGSADEAAAFFDLEVRMLHKKDEIMSEGVVRITSSEYRDVRNGSHRGILAEKTIKVSGQVIQSKTLVMTRGPVLLEMSLQDVDMEDAKMIELGSSLLDAVIG